MEDPGRDQAQDELVPVHHDRVPGVRPTLVTDDVIRLGREEIDDLALALVAPLRAEDAEGRHGSRAVERGRGKRPILRTLSPRDKPEEPAARLSRPRAAVAAAAWRLDRDLAACRQPARPLTGKAGPRARARAEEAQPAG